MRNIRERLEMALRGANLVTWDWNAKTGAVWFNDRWAEMLNYRLDEIEPDAQSRERLVHPEDLPALMEVLNAHPDRKTTYYMTALKMSFVGRVLRA